MMRTIVICKCKLCGTPFQATSTFANCCNECWEVSIVFMQNGEEWYINVPKRDSDNKVEELQKQGCYRICIKPLICEAF